MPSRVRDSEPLREYQRTMGGDPAQDPKPASSGRLRAAGAGAATTPGGPQQRAAGAALGAATAKRRAPAPKGRSLRGNGRKALVAELVLCLLLVAFSPLSDTKAPDAGAFLRQSSALAALFILLGLLSAAGRGPTRLAAGVGGIVTLGLAVSHRDILVQVAKRVQPTKAG